jgi:hypothetical protein
VENLEDNGDINRASDSIRRNIVIFAQESLGYCESEHHKPWFDEKYSKLAGRKNQVKLELLQDPSEVNEE